MFLLGASARRAQGAPVSGVRPAPPQRVPTLTEVVEFDLPPSARPVPVNGPAAAAATTPAVDADAALQARVLAHLQRQIEAGFESRLREALAPALARAADALIRDLRDELALALQAQVARAVAHELARLGGPAGRDSGTTPD